MKNRWIALLLAVALLLALSGCAMVAQKEDVVVKTEESEEETKQSTEESSQDDPTEESTTTEPTTEMPTEPAFTVDEQLALIAANHGTWMNGEEMFSPELFYTVTDLDQNGRLEVLFGCSMGTGIFTYVDVWQVNEDCTALEKANSFEEGYSQADIILSQTDVYYDEEADVYYYMFTDDARSGWMWNGTDKRAVWLKDGAYNEKTLATRSCDTDEEYNSVTTYYDAIGNEITEEEFEAMPATVHAELQKLRANILWQRIAQEALAEVNEEELLLALQEAAAGFSLS